MPLLKRKAIKPVPTPSLDDFEENIPVYMMRFTNEIFTNYEDYINRYFFYKQKNWQCETTGKSGLTYEEALESEHKEKSMVANYFPAPLRKPLLEFVQFQTARIDAVVDDAFAKFKNLYFLNEPVTVAWDGTSAVIRKVLPEEEWTTVKDGASEPEEPGQYLVRVVDKRGRGIEDMERVVDCSLLSRERLAFNKNIIRKYVRECSSKESYIGAPWIVKPSLVKKYGIETKLPADLQAARESAFTKLKKRKGGVDPAPALAAAKKAKKEAAEKPTKEKSPQIVIPVEMKPVIKYPIEDLELESSNTKKEDEDTLLARPIPVKDRSVPQDSFEALVMSWQFLNSFSTPLKLSPFGMKDFEDSLAHTDVEHPSVMVAEYHSTLMNVIIHDRLKGIAKPILAPGGAVPNSSQALEEREQSVMTDDEESIADDGDLSVGGHDEYIQRRKLPHRPINERVVIVGQGWDEMAVSASRQGWEAVLVGLINELGSFEAIPNVDRILNHLVPNETTVKEDVEQLYPTLPFEDKVSIIVFLVETAAGTSTVRHYMEECREQLKALRLQKFDINKERRQLQLEWTEFERMEAIENKNAALEKSAEEQRSAASTPEPSQDGDSDTHAANGDMSRSESRQEKLKRQQMEREQHESRRNQDLLRQRALNKARSAEQKMRYDARKRLMDRESALNRKEEQVDRDSRRYGIARVRPLGKDRFYNRYWYFDGLTMDHGTDRLYVQSPSFLDLEVMRTSADKNKILRRQRIEDPAGGLDELLRLHDQEIASGLAQEKAARERKLLLEKERALDTDDEDDKDLKTRGVTNGSGAHHQNQVDESLLVQHIPTQWSFYDEPEQVDNLLRWLDSKGIREKALQTAINNNYDLIVGGMQRRHYDLVTLLQKEQNRRSTRTKTVQASEGYLGYLNRYSK
ncbi:hypothetical protein BGZ95_001189 [Linnemannia exigua]|uniref:Uncharacterized protein n=1 Tax=Linnemannia exigua TaxID=604196 RepID=A0AAD4D8Z8_9FUNG|nr:hypothetical protein BGZ95_001189 [Linnemannia exigua]